MLSCGTASIPVMSKNHGCFYAVPLSYAYHDSKNYFHCAKFGHKLDAIADEPKSVTHWKPWLPSIRPAATKVAARISKASSNSGA